MLTMSTVAISLSGSSSYKFCHLYMNSFDRSDILNSEKGTGMGLVEILMYDSLGPVLATYNERHGSGTVVR